MAKASVHLINIDKKIYDKNISPICNHVNVGSGKEISINETSMLIKEIVDYHGSIVFNSNMPDGTNRKLLDISKIQSLGWSPSISLVDGLKKTYSWFLNNQ